MALVRREAGRKRLLVIENPEFLGLRRDRNYKNILPKAFPKVKIRFVSVRDKRRILKALQEHEQNPFHAIFYAPWLDVAPPSEKGLGLTKPQEFHETLKKIAASNKARVVLISCKMYDPLVRQVAKWINPHETVWRIIEASPETIRNQIIELVAKHLGVKPATPATLIKR